jgi:hypothetical protein
MNRDFILELATLLHKYNANITFNYDRDGGCFDDSDENITVDFNDKKEFILSDRSRLNARGCFKVLCMNDAQWESYCKTGLQPLL